MEKMRWDNTLKVKGEADEGHDAMIRFERLSAPIAAYTRDELVNGDTVYSIDGGEGTVDLVEGNDLSVNGQWRRRDEWKLSPWAAEEREAYFAHRSSENARVASDVETFNEMTRKRTSL